MSSVVEALYTGAGMLWKALWALSFGYLISAGIQVLVTRESMARTLGEPGVREASLAGLFGFDWLNALFLAVVVALAVLRRATPRAG